MGVRALKSKWAMCPTKWGTTEKYKHSHSPLFFCNFAFNMLTITREEGRHTTMTSPWPHWDLQLHATWIPLSLLSNLPLSTLWLNIIPALPITLFPSQIHFSISAFSPPFPSMQAHSQLPPTHLSALPPPALTPLFVTLSTNTLLCFPHTYSRNHILCPPSPLRCTPFPNPLAPSAPHLTFPPHLPCGCFSGSPHCIRRLSLLPGPVCHLLFTHSQVFPPQLCF